MLRAPHQDTSLGREEDRVQRETEETREHRSRPHLRELSVERGELQEETEPLLNCKHVDGDRENEREAPSSVGLP